MRGYKREESRLCRKEELEDIHSAQKKGEREDEDGKGEAFIRSAYLTKGGGRKKFYHAHANVRIDGEGKIYKKK
jgi:hypothetical protein